MENTTSDLAPLLFFDNDALRYIQWSAVPPVRSVSGEQRGPGVKVATRGSVHSASLVLYKDKPGEPKDPYF